LIHTLNSIVKTTTVSEGTD